MKNNIIRKKIVNSIGFRLIAIFISVMCVILLTNIYIYINVNRIISDINKVYEKNFTLNVISEQLQCIQKSMTEYLENKNTDSMENYYRYVQEYDESLNKLNDKTVDDRYLLMEKNILNMSDEYISLTDQCIEYKRGRDIVRYSNAYDESVIMCRYILDYIDSLNNSIFISNSTNYQTMISVMKRTQQLSVGILFVASILIVIWVMYATTKITSPLKRLANAANKVAEGNLDIDPVEITTEDEVGVVTNAFNKMLYSIREYIQRITDNMERELLMNTHLNEARLNYLQAQVNPHFLFNTLNAGAQLAMMEEADRTYQYIQNVADFYRYNVSNNKSVTLKEELELVDNYIYIINVRYSGAIHYIKEIDTSVTSVLVPSMILQPIVENSVKHGVRDIDWVAKITVSVTYEDNAVYVSVRDNGVGMATELIDDIYSAETRIYDRNESEDTNGVGLKNVMTRLRLFYEIDDVMLITSEGKDMGTEVVLIIPYQDGGSDV